MNSKSFSPNRLSLIHEEPTSTSLSTEDPNPAAGTSNAVACSSGVLRPGESIETFFQFSESTNPEYELLCRRLVVAPTPRLWNQILKLTTATGIALRRLYRRATFLYPLGGDKEKQTKTLVLDLWLSYARIQPLPEALRTLQYISIHSWTQAYAAFYVCCAELDSDKASEHLRKGMEAKAEPIVELEHAVTLLDDQTRKVNANHASPSQLPHQSTHATPNVHQRSNTNKENHFTSIGKMSATRLKDSENGHHKSGAYQQEPTPTRKNLCFGSNSKTNPPRLDLSSSKIPRSRLDHEVLKLTSQTNPEQDASRTKNSKKPPLATKRDPESITKKTVSFARPETSEDLSYILSWEPSVKGPANQGSNRKRSRDDGAAAGTTPRPSRISKKDLDYMFNWNPADRNSCTKEATGSSNGSNVSKEAITERSIDPNDVPSSSNATRDHISREAMDVNPQSHEPTDRPRQNAVSENTGVHQDFIHLVRPDNIILVNNVPYMKLDVIGKGGSCKVYRVMTTTGSIRALKKVKLNGVNADSIEGYTNEISLLKKLSNNPAIIHLYDSEVVPNKVIHFIMEVGEVDLNHVLQKKQSQEGGLNINFIRLTWMQMLKAVHSIHEERIIHGNRFTGSLAGKLITILVQVI